MSRHGRLSIVIVVDHAHVNGGQAKVALDSAIGLAGQGHAVTVFAAVAPVDERLATAGITVVCLDQPDAHTAGSQANYAVQALWNRPAAKRLEAMLATCDAARTVVHVHGWAKALSPSIGPVLRRSGLACVATMHEFFLVCPNGGFFDFPANTACTRAPLGLSCLTHNCDSRSPVHKAYRVVRQGVVNGVSGLKHTFRHMITISELQHRVASPWLPADTVYHRVPNPVAIDDAGAPRPIGERSDFLFVGRLSPEKGVGIALEAVRNAGRAIDVVGDGPERADLEAAFPQARFLGWMAPDAVRSRMANARALLFPSVWYEGQPLTVLEAQAVGTPVLVSDICAGREAVEDGRTGLHVACGDPAAWALAVRRLTDDATAQAMANAAHASYWAAPLTLARHLDGLAAVYAAALADRAS